MQHLRNRLWDILSRSVKLELLWLVHLCQFWQNCTTHTTQTFTIFTSNLRSIRVEPRSIRTATPNSYLHSVVRYSITNTWSPIITTLRGDPPSKNTIRHSRRDPQWFSRRNLIQSCAERGLAKLIGLIQNHLMGKYTGFPSSTCCTS